MEKTNKIGFIWHYLSLFIDSDFMRNKWFLFKTKYTGSNGFEGTENLRARTSKISLFDILTWGINCLQICYFYHWCFRFIHKTFFLFFKNSHHCWLNSFHWPVALAKYARESFDDKSTTESTTTLEIFERTTPAWVRISKSAHRIEQQPFCPIIKTSQFYIFICFLFFYFHLYFFPI